MKRSFLSIALLPFIGGSKELIAEESLPMGWLADRFFRTDYDETYDGDHLAKMMEYSGAPIPLGQYQTGQVPAVKDNQSLSPLLKVAYDTEYWSGGYLSNPLLMNEHYPTSWDYDSLTFWQDLADQLAGWMKTAASGSHLHGYGFWGTDYDNKTQHSRRRMTSGYRYMIEVLDDPTLKSFAYFNYLPGTTTFDSLDNRDGKGLDVWTTVTVSFTNNPSGPSHPNFQTWLDARIDYIDRCCQRSQQYNMEFWPEILFDRGEHRYCTQSELRVITNLSLLYGAKGFCFYYFSWYSTPGVGVVDADGKPYMNDVERDEIFGVGSDVPFNSDYSIYYDVWKVAQEIHEVGPVFRQLYARDGVSVNNDQAKLEGDCPTLC